MQDTGTTARQRRARWLESAGDLELAYGIFRITLGVNIFFHGFMRLLTGLSAFVTTQGAAFTDTPLPMWSVHAFLYTLPFIEVVLGFFTALGLLTRWALLGGCLMMFVLVFGNLMRQEWGTVGNNMHYVLYYCLLIAGLRYNWMALDNRKA